MTVFLTPLLFTLPDFNFYAHANHITPALITQGIFFKKGGKMHRACLSNTTVFYSLLSCQWK